MSPQMRAALVKSILERHLSYEWTQQGFGFFRTKLQGVGRIHVWDERVATPLVSTMHTHPWDFTSTVISGELVNHRFLPTCGPLRYLASRIATGEGGGLLGEPAEMQLAPCAPEVLYAGDSYAQLSGEIHRTIAQAGTVTLVERKQGPPLEEAFVYWPRGTSWVSAEPKPAIEWRLTEAIQYALARWNP